MWAKFKAMRAKTEAVLAVVLLLSISILAIVACTDTQKASFGALGRPGHITCYSGGKPILDENSTGKIASETQSDGWKFQSATDNKLVRVSGDCVIRN